MELSYPSGNGTFLCLGKGIFITMTYLELETYSEHCQTFMMERLEK